MKTVFLDVDTQLDFVCPGGALYVPGAESLIGTWAKLGAHAKASGIPLLSTMDAHTENDPEFRVWPHHCVRGTLGQRKPQVLQFGQTVISKRVLDPFAADDLKVALQRLEAERCVVYGVVTEICVRLAVLGAVKLGLQVDLVRDAVRELDAAKGRQACDELASEGVKLVSFEEVVGR